MKYDKQGRELPDDTPVEVPLRFRQTAGNGDILQAMMQRLREEQEKEIAETSQEFAGDEEPEVFDLPTRYELDHDAEERALLFAENAEKIRRRELSRKKEKQDEDGNERSGKARGNRRAGRDDRESGSAGEQADGATDREGGDSENAARGASGER